MIEALQTTFIIKVVFFTQFLVKTQSAQKMSILFQIQLFFGSLFAHHSNNVEIIL
ncbi:hypothetical protein N481_02605 [Pseudoalteromonas luteoviolacea S4047-1]|nr:hypothetical protein N481_02605 [Pseudoalteromonas luteoviolacea S4047-1]